MRIDIGLKQLTVTIKLIEPAIDDIPAKCKENIAKSTLAPECADAPDKGGYTVQPVPTPDSTTPEKSRRAKEGGISQKLKLFNRGNAISGAPIKTGKNRFP